VKLPLENGFLQAAVRGSGLLLIVAGSELRQMFGEHGHLAQKLQRRRLHRGAAAQPQPWQWIPEIVWKHLNIPHAQPRPELDPSLQGLPSAQGRMQSQGHTRTTRATALPVAIRAAWSTEIDEANLNTTLVGKQLPLATALQSMRSALDLQGKQFQQVRLS